MCLKKRPPFKFLNNSVKTESISIIFGVQYPEEISHTIILNFASLEHIPIFYKML